MSVAEVPPTNRVQPPRVTDAMRQARFAACDAIVGDAAAQWLACRATRIATMARRIRGRLQRLWRKKRRVRLYVGMHWGRSFDRRFRDYEVCYGFEANPEVFRELRKRYSKYPNVHLANVAVCQHDGEVEFHISNNDGASSSMGHFGPPAMTVAAERRFSWFGRPSWPGIAAGGPGSAPLRRPSPLGELLDHALKGPPILQVHPSRIEPAQRICFVHKDTEMLDPRWLERLEQAVGDGGRVGLAGLYGSRLVRSDGSYWGRGIIHCLAEGSTRRQPMVEVAAVDGVCLFIPRAVLAEVGGFDESYGFFHGYDRDLSFAVRATGRRCAVVKSRFTHRGGGTRTGPAAPVSAMRDLEQRRETTARFVRKWEHMLPADTRSVRERLADRLRPLLWPPSDRRPI